MQYTVCPRKYRGFGILDSMLALLMLATIILGGLAYNAQQRQHLEAEELLVQTEAFAAAYAAYARKIISQQVEFLPTGSVTWAPSSIIWPTGLVKQNLYKQIPCLTISRNSNSGELEAVMYYVGGKTEITNQRVNTIRDAAIGLRSKGGIFLNGVTTGNSGWSLASASPLIKGGGACVSFPSNNSVVVNMNLLPAWREWEYLQTPTSITRGLDQALDPLQLPGRMRNFNTLKTNINIANKKGIILNNIDSNSPLKLGIQYNGASAGAATLGFGNNSTSTIIADTIQPSNYFQAGQACTANEIGKTVADQGISGITQYLARSTLVCTQNDMLCGTGSYCYLPSISNKIVFRNAAKGVQDSAGQFICPIAVPFAVASSTPVTYADIYTGFKVGDSLQNLTPPNIVNYNLGNVAYTILRVERSFAAYTTNLGYRLSSKSMSCNTVCSRLNSILGNQWRQNPVIKINLDSGCACERVDLDSSSNITIIQFRSSQLPSVTCSNMPVYIVN